MNEIVLTKEAMASLRYFCLFIGYPYSGHSLVGSILDAHPEVVISHELHVGRLIKKGLTREQIFAMIVLNSNRFAQIGRTWNHYSYAIPGAWNGQFRRMTVIGDKKGGKSANFFTNKSEIIGQIEPFFGLTARYIHVIRNPFDIISTLYRKSNRAEPDKMRHAVEKILKQIEKVEHIRRSIEPGCWLDLHHEALITDPTRTITGLFDFFDLTVPEGFLDNCRKILYASPHQSRHDIHWKEEEINWVSERLAKFTVFSTYTFDDK